MDKPIPADSPYGNNHDHDHRCCGFLKKLEYKLNAILALLISMNPNKAVDLNILFGEQLTPEKPAAPTPPA